MSIAKAVSCPTPQSRRNALCTARQCATLLTQRKGTEQRPIFSWDFFLGLSAWAPRGITQVGLPSRPRGGPMYHSYRWRGATSGLPRQGLILIAVQIRQLYGERIGPDVLGSMGWWSTTTRLVMGKEGPGEPTGERQTDSKRKCRNNNNAYVVFRAGGVHPNPTIGQARVLRDKCAVAHQPLPHCAARPQVDLLCPSAGDLEVEFSGASSQPPSPRRPLSLGAMAHVATAAAQERERPAPRADGQCTDTGHGRQSVLRYHRVHCNPGAGVASGALSRPSSVRVGSFTSVSN